MVAGMPEDGSDHQGHAAEKLGGVQQHASPQPRGDGAGLKALQLEGSASLPGSFLPNGFVFAGPKTIVAACTNQNLWSGISKWVGFSKQQMGLIAVLRHSEGSGHYSLAQSFKTEEPCTAIEINIGEDAAGGSPSSSKCVYVGQQDGLVEVYKLDSSDSLTRDWGFTAHSLDVTCLKLVGENKETLVTCGLDRRLRIYDVANRNFVADIEVGGAGIACLLTEASYFMNDAEVLVGSMDGKIYGVTLKDETSESGYGPKVVKVLPDMHSGSVQCMCMSSASTRGGVEGRGGEAGDGKGMGERKLFTGSFDTTVGHWLQADKDSTKVGKSAGKKGDGDSGRGQEEEQEEEAESERVKFAGRLCGHSATVRSLAWLGNEGGRGDLLTGGADGNICQYRLETFGYRPTSVTRAHDYSVTQMAWDGERLVTASDDSTFKTWSFQEFVAAVPRGYV